MLAELNESYEILSDPSKRKKLDESENEGKAPEVGKKPENPSHYQNQTVSETIVFPTGGTFALKNLPTQAKQILRKRQSAKIEPQIRIYTHKAGVQALLGFFSFAWFLTVVKLSGFASLWVWNGTHAPAVISGFGVFAGIWSVMGLAHWIKADIIPAVYITPVYYIKTTYKKVTYIPLWTLKTYQYTLMDGSRKKSIVKLTFQDREENIKTTPEQLGNVINALQIFDKNIVECRLTGNQNYIAEHDDLGRAA